MAKKDVITVHSVEITLKPGVAASKDGPGQRPVTKTIPPGSLISVEDGDDLNDLRSAGAVKDADGTHTRDLRKKDDAESAASDTGIGANLKREDGMSTDPRFPGAGSNPAPAIDGAEDAGQEATAKPNVPQQTGAAAKTPTPPAKGK